MSLKFTGIRFTEIKADVESFIRNEYNKSGILFSVASPYGQILSVLENLHQLSMMYLKNTITNLDLTDANSNNERIITNAAIMAGHIPTRSISASGTLKFTVKPGVDLEKEVPGAKITIGNKTRLKNTSNGLDYVLSLGSDFVTHKLTPNYTFYVNVQQGYWASTTRTGNGLPLQTFTVNEVGGNDIDNFAVEVLVNGELWTIKRHIYDMIPDEKAVVVRTSLNFGIDVIFGNEYFGMMPPLGSVVEIRHLVTRGADGNIYRRTKNDWEIISTVLDGSGDTIDMKKTFNIDFYTDINFGSNGESFQFTKQMLPYVTNNAVLALPQHFAYEIKKLGVFSHVNAYEKTGTIFITVTPNINLFKNQSANYFSVSKQAFILDNFERKKIDRYLRGNGSIMLTQKYKVITPKLSYYAINVFVIPYSDASDESVNAQILEVISNYFLNLNRMERIPKLDIIKGLSAIQDIHSVDIFFISRKNEDYHRNGISQMNNLNPIYSSSVNYEPDLVLGLDPVMGDILFEPDELPIVRGDWHDRNGSYISDDIDGNTFKAVNIIRKGTANVRDKNK